jgi:hypothetical protein
MPAKAGIQECQLKLLDSGFCRNDDKEESVLVQSFPNTLIPCVSAYRHGLKSALFMPILDNTERIGMRRRDTCREIL